MATFGDRIAGVIYEAVHAAAGRAEVREAVARIYAELQEQIDLRNPRCERSGRCCRFDEYGHRLYVTTMELAASVSSLPGASAREHTTTGCPFQIAGLCSVHQIRPFGCRVFFCDRSAERWQYEQYEKFHAQLKRLHEALEVPYFYLEWRQALRELGLGSPPETAQSPRRLSLPQLQL